MSTPQPDRERPGQPATPPGHVPPAFTRTPGPEVPNRFGYGPIGSPFADQAQRTAFDGVFELLILADRLTDEYLRRIVYRMIDAYRDRNEPDAIAEFDKMTAYVTGNAAAERQLRTAAADVMREKPETERYLSYWLGILDQDMRQGAQPPGAAPGQVPAAFRRPAQPSASVTALTALAERVLDRGLRTILATLNHMQRRADAEGTHATLTELTAYLYSERHALTDLQTAAATLALDNPDTAPYLKTFMSSVAEAVGVAALHPKGVADTLGGMSLSEQYDQMQRLMTTAPYPGAAPFTAPEPLDRAEGDAHVADLFDESLDAEAAARRAFDLGPAEAYRVFAEHTEDPALRTLLRALEHACAARDTAAGRAALRNLARYTAAHHEARRDMVEALGHMPDDGQTREFAVAIAASVSHRDQAEIWHLMAMRDMVTDAELARLLTSLAIAPAGDEDAAAGLLTVYLRGNPGAHQQYSEALKAITGDAHGRRVAADLVARINRLDEQLDDYLPPPEQLRYALAAFGVAARSVTDPGLAALLLSVADIDPGPDARGAESALHLVAQHLISHPEAREQLAGALQAVAFNPQIDDAVREAAASVRERLGRVIMRATGDGIPADVGPEAYLDERDGTLSPGALRAFADAVADQRLAALLRELAAAAHGGQGAAVSAALRAVSEYVAHGGAEVMAQFGHAVETSTGRAFDGDPYAVPRTAGLLVQGLLLADGETFLGPARHRHAVLGLAMTAEAATDAHLIRFLRVLGTSLLREDEDGPEGVAQAASHLRGYLERHPEAARDLDTALDRLRADPDYYDAVAAVLRVAGLVAVPGDPAERESVIAQLREQIARAVNRFTEHVTDRALYDEITRVFAAYAVGGSAKLDEALSDMAAFLAERPSAQAMLLAAMVALGVPPADGDLLGALGRYVAAVIGDQAAPGAGSGLDMSGETGQYLDVVGARLGGELRRLVMQLRAAVGGGLHAREPTQRALNEIARYLDQHPALYPQLVAALDLDTGSTDVQYHSLLMLAHLRAAMRTPPVIEIPAGLSAQHAAEAEALRERGRVLLDHLSNFGLRLVVNVLTEAAMRRNRLVHGMALEGASRLMMHEGGLFAQLHGALAALAQLRPQDAAWARSLVEFFANRMRGQDVSPYQVEQDADAWEAVNNFLCGPVAVGSRTGGELMPPLYARLLADTGVERVLGAIGGRVDTAAMAITVSVLPEGIAGLEGSGFDTAVLDVPEVMVNLAVAEGEAHDGAYERVVARWRRTRHVPPVPLRPADVGAIRLGVAATARAVPILPDGEQYADANTLRLNDTLAAAAVYTATPYFLPHGYVRTLLGAPPPLEVWSDIYLPARYTLVFHDPVALREMLAASAAPDASAHVEQQAAMIERQLGPGLFVLGCVLMADDDFRLDTSSGWLLCGAAVPNDKALEARGYFVLYGERGEHPAASYLLNVADLLAHFQAEAPPELPPATGVEGSNSGRARQMKTDEARKGAYHRVHVVTYLPPPERAARTGDEPGRARGPLKWGHWRRAHPHRFRVTILDGDGRPVGPVHGPDAEEGVTFEYVTKVLPPKRVRQDAPLRRGDTTVYRLPTPGGDAR